MGNFMLRYLLRALVLAAALFCWVQALLLSGDMVKSAGSVSFRYGTDGIPCATVDRMLEEESVPFAAWAQKNNQRVREPEFSRDTDLQVLEITGDAELTLPAEELLYGFLPVRESVDTCAVDSATAYALWGGMDVTGEILLYEDREYIVTGIFSRPENTMLVQSKLKKDILFPCLELSVSDAATSRQQADEFRARYSLPEPDILIDHLETTAILRQFTRLPALLVSILLLWRILQRCFGKPVSFLGRAGFVMAMAAGVIMSAWAIGFSPAIPAAAIPGCWSDFSFWSGLMEDMVKQARLSRTLSWPAPDLLQLQDQHSVLFYSGGALAGVLISILCKPGKRGEERQDGVYNAEKYS